MNNDTPRFAIFGNTYQAKKSASIRNLLTTLNRYGAPVAIDREYYTFLTHTLHLLIEHVEVFDDDRFDADFAISMGGDGTFLRTAARVGNRSIPLVGINMGRLGFLADVNPCDVEGCIHSLVKGNYEIETREVIEVKTDGETFKESPYALNDVAILKRDDASMISIRTVINGHYLTTYEADGLIVSTPTGSTAYSLSNGGPIMVPGTHVFLLTAVAPHSLNVRPIVIGHDAEIELKVSCRSKHFLVAIDGRSEHCCEGVTLTLRRAPFDVNIVKSHTDNYFRTLRNKMMWGNDLRDLGGNNG